MNRALARRIEPRVPPPEARLEILRKAKASGLSVGVIVAPVFPPTADRPDFVEDLATLFRELAVIRPDHIYGESLHVRGENTHLVERALGEPVVVGREFDRAAERAFQGELRAVGLRGTWWPEK
jgi:DNA repair photolyase